MHLTSLNNFVLFIAILLGIANSVYLLRTRPSVLLKRSLLRHRLLHMPINGTLRLKRQLFREDIPHDRPLSGNTYYLHAGFPHPSRWYDGPQLISPNPNPITHHHLQHHHGHGLHDDGHDQHHHHHHPHPHQQSHNQHQNNELQLQHPAPAPIIIENLDHNKNPLSVTIQSAVVHNNGVIDNSIVNSPPPPLHSGGHGQTIYDRPLGHVRNTPRKKKPPKPHTEPELYDDFEPSYGPVGVDYDGPSKDYGPPPPPSQHGQTITEHINPSVTKKPKTVIHYHPVQVGNIINFNDDHKPLHLNHHESYGPPKHIPGVPLAHKDILMTMAEPFLNSPFKSVNGEPDYLSFSNHGPGPGPSPGPGAQYGPPNHQPGPPLDSLPLPPLGPSYGPPINHNHDSIPPYGVALPVLAHFHSGTLGHPSHRPPKRQRGRHQHHLHYHHVHHHHPPSPPPHSSGESPFFDVKYPTYVVHGHGPKKFPFHSPHYRSRPHKFFQWGL